MTRKKQFPGTDLDTKIKKSQNAKEVRSERLTQLYKFYDLDKEGFDRNDPSPWRKLCYEMALHLISGFQENKSGNIRRNTIHSDYEIYQCYNPLVTAEYEFCENATQEWLNLKLTKKERIAIAAKKTGCTFDKARHAILRFEKHFDEDPASFYEPNLGSSTYITSEPKADRHSRNRKSSPK